MSKKQLTVIVFTICALVAPMFIVHAQNAPSGCAGGNTGQGFVPLEPCSPLYAAEQSVNIETLLQTLYNICVGIAVVLAILQLSRAGITYMLSDSITSKEQARHLITTSVLGLILVLSPVIIFSLIDPTILQFNFNIDALKVAPEGSNGSPSGGLGGSPGGGTTGGSSTGGSGCSSGSGSC